MSWCRWSLLGSSAVLGLALLVGASCVDAAEEKRPWYGWKTLRLKTRGSLFRGQVELRVVDGTSGRRLETATRAKFLGAVVARSESTTEFDAEGRVLEYVSYSKKRGRRYVFGDEGYTVDKLRPREEADGTEDRWRVSSHLEFDAPRSGGNGESVRLFDYFGMLLHLRELPLSRIGDEVELHVATSKGPQPYRILVTKAREAEREFTDLATGDRKVLPLRELRLSILPADPEAEEGFLNMVGETEVWVEAASKSPLEIAGKIPKIPGRVRLILAAME